MMRSRELDRERYREIQQQLNALGFGPLVVDGIWGRRSRAAYERYQATRPQEIEPPIQPAAKPWWLSIVQNAGLALVLVGIGNLLGADWDQATVAGVLEHGSEFLFGLLVLAGNWRRKGSIDHGLVARWGGRDLRWPGGVRRGDGVSADGDARRDRFRA